MTDEEMAEKYAIENWGWYEDGQRDYIAIKEAFLAGLAGKDKAIKDLKEDNKVMSDNYSKMEQKFYDNLTHAKELLRELYVIVKAGCSPFFKDEHKTTLIEIKEFLEENT